MTEQQRPISFGESQIEVAPPPLPRFRTFASLRNRNYLWYWLGQIAAFTGLQMGIIARGWLVWTMTGSELAIGIVSFVFGVPILLFTAFGGVVADRVVKRNLLIGTQTFQALIALSVATLVATDRIEFWHLLVAAVCGGFLFVFNGPARQAIIPELVKKEELLNAIALNSSAMNLTRMAGPVTAGALMAFIGIAGVYYLVAASYLAAVVALCRVSPSGVTEKSLVRQEVNSRLSLARTIWIDLAEGFHYMRHSPLILSLLGMALIPLALGLPYLTLLPVFADKVFHVGELGFGILVTMAGVGALTASLSIASLGSFRRKGMLLLLLALAFGTALALFGLSHSFLPSLVLLAAVGAGGSGYMAVNNTLVQSNVPERLLGRVMSIYMLSFALMPIGALPAGALAEVIGAPIAVVMGGISIVLFTLAMAVLQPSVRRLE
jgi:MFS family permease